MATSVPWNTLWEMLFQYEVIVSLVSSGLERDNFRESLEHCVVWRENPNLSKLGFT